MAFTPTLNRYELAERPTAQANGTNTGKAGDQQLFDVVNTLNGETSQRDIDTACACLRGADCCERKPTIPVSRVASSPRRSLS